MQAQIPISESHLERILECAQTAGNARVWIEDKFSDAPWIRQELLDRLGDTRTPIEKSRDECEESLHAFASQAWNVVKPGEDFIDGWHIKAICDHLEAVTTGDIRHLLINIPPGHMKSFLCSVFWPCWVWTHWPESSWFFASYNDELTNRDSKRRRDIFQSSWWKERWGNTMPMSESHSVFKFSIDENLKTRYSNNCGGSMISSTVGGMGTGEHPHFIVIDDPHNVKKAQSYAERTQAIDWIDQTLGSRGIILDSRRVMVMQRLHENDASAHVIEKGYWTHMMLPARYEANHKFAMKDTPLGWNDPRTVEGEILWKEAFPEDKLAFEERELGGEYACAGQLQQRPSKVGGNIIKEEWFLHFEMRGQLLRPKSKEGELVATIDERQCSRYAFIDTAGTDKDVAKQQKGKPPSYTACLIVDCWAERGFIFARHMARGLWGWEEMKYQIPKVLNDWNVERVFIEDKHWGSRLKDFLKRQVTMLKDNGQSKLERSTDWQDKLQYGEFFIPAEPVPWRRKYIDECTSWTGHPEETSDQIDVSSYACREIKQKKQSWGGQTGVDKSEVSRYAPKTSGRAW
jgi:hypothetical protein